MTMKFIFAITALACLTAANASVKELPRRQDILSIMRKACDLEYTSGLKNNWIYSTYFAGMLATYRSTGNRKYRDQALSWASSHSWAPKGRISTTNADRQCCLQTYLELYLLDPGAHNEFMIENAEKNLNYLVKTKKAEREIWSWCDALFMAPPALAMLARIKSDRTYLDAMDRLWWDTYEHLYDKEEHLFYRDDSYIYPEKKTLNGKKIFWSRGNGWVIAGLARILQHMPGNYSERGKYILLFKDMARALRAVQGDDGLWRTSLVDSAEFPKPETSGTALITFAMAWGINNGLLDESVYLPVVVHGWQGLTRMTDNAGAVRWVQKIGEAPGDTDKETSMPYATGALLLAGEEMLKLISKIKTEVPEIEKQTESE